MFGSTARKLSGVLLVPLVAIVSRGAFSQDVTFSKVWYASSEQHTEVPVTLSLTESKIVIKSKKASKKAQACNNEISYSSIDSMSYAAATRHRLGEGGALAGLSLGASAVIMATKTTSYWLRIGYHEGETKRVAILQLDKSEYENVLTALKSKSGKPIVTLDSKTSNELLPTAGSKNVDEVVPFEMEKVAAALRPAMESHGCKVTAARKGLLECKRPRRYSERTGSGAEKITAKLEPKGAKTRVRIKTGKGMLGRLGKRNWSTPIYQAMLKTLQER
jgi:hypothetical protein